MLAYRCEVNVPLPARKSMSWRQLPFIVEVLILPLPGLHDWVIFTQHVFRGFLVILLQMLGIGSDMEAAVPAVQ